MTTEYFKIVSSKETEFEGAGLGYEELYGHEPRYFLSRTQANARAAELNNPPPGAEELSLTYSVIRRKPGDDDDDSYFVQQIGQAVGS